MRGTHAFVGLWLFGLRRLEHALYVPAPAGRSRSIPCRDPERFSLGSWYQQRSFLLRNHSLAGDRFLPFLFSVGGPETAMAHSVELDCGWSCELFLRAFANAEELLRPSVGSRAYRAD